VRGSTVQHGARRPDALRQDAPHPR
jgi:hypothetical protein